MKIPIHNMPWIYWTCDARWPLIKAKIELFAEACPPITIRSKTLPTNWNTGGYVSNGAELNEGKRERRKRKKEEETAMRLKRQYYWTILCVRRFYVCTYRHVHRRHIIVHRDNLRIVHLFRQCHAGPQSITANGEDNARQSSVSRRGPMEQPKGLLSFGLVSLSLSLFVLWVSKKKLKNKEKKHTSKLFTWKHDKPRKG